MQAVLPLSTANDDFGDSGEDRWLPYPVAERILAHMQEMLDVPQSDRPPGMLVYGQTNNGKTTVARRFQRLVNAQARRGKEGDEMPVVYVQTPPGPDVGHACALLLRAVGAAVPATATRQRRVEQVTAVLPKVGARMLIFDEIHNILTGASGDTMYFLNFLKFISNELRLPIVTVGTDEARVAMQTDQQIGNRFTPMQMPPWRVDREFALFAIQVFRGERLDGSDLFRNTEAVRKLHAQTAGLTGEVRAFARKVAARAVDPGHKLAISDLNVPGWMSPDGRRR